MAPVTLTWRPSYSILTTRTHVTSMCTQTPAPHSNAERSAPTCSAAPPYTVPSPDAPDPSDRDGCTHAPVESDSAATGPTSRRPPSPPEHSTIVPPTQRHAPIH